MSARGGMLIGVDLGTTGLKAALYSADGAPLAERTAPTPLRWHGTGRVDQDPDDFLRAATSAIAECVRAGGGQPEVATSESPSSLSSHSTSSAQRRSSHES